MAYGMKMITPQMVNESDDPAKLFCEYAQQRIGIPRATARDVMAVKKKAKLFFEEYPHTNWTTLCKVVVWMVANKRRVPNVHGVIDNYRYAWAKGQLPELDPANMEDPEADHLIREALKIETDELWRRRLIMATPSHKREVYEFWRQNSVVA